MKEDPLCFGQHLNPCAAVTLLCRSRTISLGGLFLVTTKSGPSVVTVAYGDEVSSPLTRGSTKGPVFVHAHVVVGRLASMNTNRSTDCVTPLALWPVILKVNVPIEGELDVRAVKVDETEPPDGTVI